VKENEFGGTCGVSGGVSRVSVGKRENRRLLEDLDLKERKG
jgi:hypothetical protein